MKRNIITIIAVLTVSQLLFGFIWGQKGRVKKLRQKVDALASEIDAVFMKTYEIINTLDSDFEHLFATKPLADVDISGMDEENGGRYHLFQDTFYTRRYAKDADECASFATGAYPVGENEKRRLKLLLEMEPRLMQFARENSFISLLGFMTLQSGSLMCPNFDAVATLPLGINFAEFPWFTFTITEARNEAKRLAAPLVTLATEGWVHSVGSGVYAGDDPQGITFLDIGIYRVNKALLKDETALIFIAFEDGTIINSTPEAKSRLGLPVLAPYDYLEQLEDNPQLNEEIRLTHSGQPEGFRQLGALIAQRAKAGEVMIDGEEYQVVIASAPEGGYFVVGLTQ